MIKKFRNVFIIFGAVVVLVGLYFLLSWLLPQKESDTTGSEEVSILQVDESSVKEVDVINKTDTFTLYKDLDGNYQIKGKEKVPLSDNDASSFVTSFASLKAIKKVNLESNDKLSEYGLDKPAATAILATGTDAYEFEIGNKTSSNDSYYLKKKGTNDVYVVSEEFCNYVLGSRFSFYNKNISRYSSDKEEDLKYLSPIIMGGTKRQKIRVEQVEDLKENEVGPGYMIKEPINQAFSTNALDVFLSLIKEFTATGIASDDVSPASLKRYGLDNPSYTLEYGIKGNITKILFGNTDKDGNIYVKNDDVDLIYIYPVSGIDFVTYQIQDLVESMSYMRDVDTVKKIVVTGLGKTYNIDILHEDENLRAFVNDKEVNSDSFSDFYSHILSIRLNGLGEKPKNAKPLVTVNLTLTDGKSDIIKYYAIDERKCFFELNGEGMFSVSRISAEKIIENCQKLYDGKQIILEW